MYYRQYKPSCVERLFRRAPTRFKARVIVPCTQDTDIKSKKESDLYSCCLVKEKPTEKGVVFTHLDNHWRGNRTSRGIHRECISSEELYPHQRQNVRRERQKIYLNGSDEDEAHRQYLNNFGTAGVSCSICSEEDVVHRRFQKRIQKHPGILADSPLKRRFFDKCVPSKSCQSLGPMEKRKVMNKTEVCKCKKKKPKRPPKKKQCNCECNFEKGIICQNPKYMENYSAPYLCHLSPFDMHERLPPEDLIKENVNEIHRERKFNMEPQKENSFSPLTSEDHIKCILLYDKCSPHDEKETFEKNNKLESSIPQNMILEPHDEKIMTHDDKSNCSLIEKTKDIDINNYLPSDTENITFSEDEKNVLDKNIDNSHEGKIMSTKCTQYSQELIGRFCNCEFSNLNLPKRECTCTTSFFEMIKCKCDVMDTMNKLNEIQNRFEKIEEKIKKNQTPRKDKINQTTFIFKQDHKNYPSRRDQTNYPSRHDQTNYPFRHINCTYPHPNPTRTEQNNDPRKDQPINCFHQYESKYPSRYDQINPSYRYDPTKYSSYYDQQKHTYPYNKTPLSSRYEQQKSPYPYNKSPLSSQYTQNIYPSSSSYNKTICSNHHPQTDDPTLYHDQKIPHKLFIKDDDDERKKEQDGPKPQKKAGYIKKYKKNGRRTICDCDIKDFPPEKIVGNKFYSNCPQYNKMISAHRVKTKPLPLSMRQVRAPRRIQEFP